MTHTVRSVTTLRCDRCSFKASYEDSDRNQYKWGSIQYAAVRNGETIMPGGSGEGGFSYDLCPNCTQSMREWFKCASGL